MATADTVRRYAGPAFLSFGFRPFFLFGAVWSALAVPIWISAFALGDGTIGAVDGRNATPRLEDDFDAAVFVVNAVFQLRSDLGDRRITRYVGARPVGRLASGDGTGCPGFR